MAEVLWYYARDNQQFGPVSASELKQLAEAGGLSPDDLLWREGMEAWATAVNLRGLFNDDASAAGVKVATAAAPQNAASGAAPPAAGQPPARTRAGESSGSTMAAVRSPRAVLRTTQIFLWLLCVLVVLVGVVLFTRAFLRADNAAEEASAGAVFSTFFVAAYVLARSGEKLCRLLMNYTRRRPR